MNDFRKVKLNLPTDAAELQELPRNSEGAVGSQRGGTRTEDRA